MVNMTVLEKTRDLLNTEKSSAQETNLCEILNIANAGDHVIYSSAIYGGIYNLITNTMKIRKTDIKRIGVKKTDIGR